MDLSGIQTAPTTAIDHKTAGDRSLGTVYTNNTGKVMYVSVSVHCITALATDTAVAFLLCPNTSSNGTGVVGLTGVAGLTLYGSMYAIVLPGGTYEAGVYITGSGSVTLDDWWEWT